MSKCASYGFIEFVRARDAHYARCRLNGESIGDSGQRIIVDWADVQ